MDIKIVEKEELPLLKRSRIVARAKYEKATPSRLEFKNTIANLLQISPDLIVIEKIKTNYCEKSAEIIAHSYKNKEDLERIEEKKILLKNQPKAQKNEATEQNK